ncbi:MAG TPA: EAL domain-containing protein [Acidimicrobiales bacterium]|jgi:diguanylate cyclase (GGDEF)-like protein|nr:EAL domain-containing protein [Acidimicrobiales bacterium]
MGHRGDGRIRVVIADDTDDVRSLLQYTLALDGRFEVVAQAADGVAAIAAAEAEQPDVVVLDLAMPVMDGMSAIPRIARVAPDARIVILSSFGARQMAEQALTLGASAYVEKATFQALTSVLVDVCRRKPARAAASEPRPAAHTPPAPAPRPTALAEDGDAARMAGLIRQARWVAVVFTLLQFLLYQPAAGTQVPFPKVAVGLLIAGVLVAVNLLSARRPMGYAPLVLDASVVLAVIWLFSFEGSPALWTLLIVTVIEAAMFGELRAALAAWALTGGVYVVREFWAARQYNLPAVTLESLTYQLGVLLLVAVATGHLARNFSRTSEEHRRARAESERRAELLGLVAEAGRKLAALDSDELLTAVVDATVALGFEGVELCSLDESTGAWRVDDLRGLEENRLGQPLDADLTEVLRHGPGAVLIEEARHQDPAERLGGPWFACGYRSVIATPIRSGETVLAALVAGRRADDRVTSSEVECLELLAAQAGVGLSNARLVERVRHQALHDALTGLPNQLLFEDRVAQAMGNAGRTGTRAALLFTDLDRFKKINDTLGHDFGNELLRQVAGRLLGVIRSGDTVARMGGDEFTLLLPNLHQGRDAGHVAEKVLDALRAPFTVGDHQLFITASVGIAVYPNDGLRYETLLQHADIAMYRSKAAGGNCSEQYAAMPDDTGYPRLSLEADLHNALLRHELRVVYQPVLDLTDGGIRAVEALVRWRHPELGEIGPAEFLPLAEEAGLMGTIDTWVMETACAKAVEWHRHGSASTLRVAVNVSGRQLQHPRFTDIVLAALVRTGLAPDMLELEVTEGSGVADGPEVRASLALLRTAGVRVAIDDFGTGYSMLSRLRGFPLDTLKIDRSFIAEIREAGDDAPIVSATIAMARSLGLEVVAEGVEVDAQVGFLRDAGCDLAQGFLLGRPLEADQVVDLLAPVG